VKGWAEIHFVVRRSSFVVRRPSFVVRRSSFVVRRSSSVVRRSSFVVCRFREYNAMQLGVMDYVIAGRDDGATFERARRLGLAGVEVGLTRAQLRDPARTKLTQLHAAREQSGLAIPSLALGEHNNGGIGSDDEITAREAAEDIRQAIDWAAELGAAVILVPFFFRGDLVSKAQIEQAAQTFRELCPLAQQRGVTLCYEGTLPAREIRRLAEMIDSPAFGCYFDLANVVWRGMDTTIEIRSLGELIRQVHIKDTRVGPGDCPPGTGRVDYPLSAAALQATSYDGWLVLETPAAPPELVARDMSFARRHFPDAAPPLDWPRFGAFSYDFTRGELDRMIAAFCEAGLSAVQLGGDLLNELLEQPALIPETRAKLDAAGIDVVALAGYRNLVAPDPQKRREHIEYLKRCLEIAPLLGTSVVATETGTRNAESDWTDTPENWSGEAWKLLEEAIEALLIVAKQHEAILALEGYVGNVLRTHGQLIGLLERFPTPHLQVVLDPYNYLSVDLLPAKERATAAFFERFEHRFVLAHLKDVGKDGAEVDTPEFGTGVFPQRMYLEFLRTRRPDLPLILEHLPFEHIPAAIQRVRGEIRD
jgi:sugar phosphate isomerase/epimerase